MEINKKNELIDIIAELELNAILNGLKDPELRRNPSFLEKVRKFMKDNDIKTTPETPGMSELKKVAMPIPVFEDLPN